MITVKIHDVLHDSGDWNMSPEELSEYIERYVNNESIENVRISKGWANSPIYVSLDTNSLSLQSARVVCRAVLKGLQHEVSGVDIDKSIRNSNIKIIDK